MRSFFLALLLLSLSVCTHRALNQKDRALSSLADSFPSCALETKGGILFEGRGSFHKLLLFDLGSHYLNRKEVSSYLLIPLYNGRYLFNEKIYFYIPKELRALGKYSLSEGGGEARIFLDFEDKKFHQDDVSELLYPSLTRHEDLSFINELGAEFVLNLLSDRRQLSRFYKKEKDILSALLLPAIFSDSEKIQAVKINNFWKNSLVNIQEIEDKVLYFTYLLNKRKAVLQSIQDSCEEFFLNSQHEKIVIEVLSREISARQKKIDEALIQWKASFKKELNKPASFAPSIFQSPLTECLHTRPRLAYAPRLDSFDAEISGLGRRFRFYDRSMREHPKKEYFTTEFSSAQKNEDIFNFSSQRFFLIQDKLFLSEAIQIKSPFNHQSILRNLDQIRFKSSCHAKNVIRYSFEGSSKKKHYIYEVADNNILRRLGGGYNLLSRVVSAEESLNEVFENSKNYCLVEKKLTSFNDFSKLKDFFLNDVDEFGENLSVDAIKRWDWQNLKVTEAASAPNSYLGYGREVNFSGDILFNSSTIERGLNSLNYWENQKYQFYYQSVDWTLKCLKSGKESMRLRKELFELLKTFSKGRSR